MQRTIDLIDPILAALQAFGLKKVGDGKYRCNSPFRTSSDSGAFSVTLDPSYAGGGKWHDHVSDEGGNFITLAQRLGLSLPGRFHETTKRVYQRLADYADAHYAPESAFIQAGWTETRHKGRHALTFKTATGSRFRFLDGDVPTYDQPSGYESCWYHLAQAVKLAYEQGLPLVLCNGEASVVTAQHYGIAAACITGGGERKVPAKLLEALQQQYHGEILIALDADQKGRSAAPKLAMQLRESGFEVRALDLMPGINDGFDLADFCGLHGSAAAAQLIELPDLPLDIPKADQVLAEQPRRTTQVEELIALAQEQCAFFRDPSGDTYARVHVGDHIEVVGLGGKGGSMRQWLEYQFLQDHRRPPSNEALQQSVSALAAIARYDAGIEPTYVRVGSYNGRLYLDLGDPRWRAVEIDASGWRIVSQPPVALLRPKGMLPLPEPQQGAPPLITTLRPLLNVSSERDWTLLVGWLVGSLMPPSVGARAHLALFGEQGSAKSTATRLLRILIDPHLADVRTAPRDEHDLAIAAKHSAILAFDNVSHLPEWLSDALCRLSTGAAFTTRELFSDDVEMLFSAKRQVVMNGISDFVNRSDLLDRLLCVTLDPIPEEQRKPEASLWQQIEAARPAILGALLDAVSTALRRLPELPQPATLPRLADFAMWVEAAAPALGWREGTMLDAFGEMRKEASERIIEGNPLASRLIKIFRNRAFVGTAQELLDTLSADFSRDNPAPKGFPKTPARLSAGLHEVAQNLKSVGLIVDDNRKKERRNGSDAKKLFRITPVDMVAASPATTLGSPLTATEEATAQKAVGSPTQPPVAAVAAVAAPKQALSTATDDTDYCADNAPLPPGWWIERCDYTGASSPYGVYFLATNGSERTEPTQYKDTAIRDGWRVAGEHQATQYRNRVD